MKRSAMTIALTFVVSASTWAGEVPSVGYAPPPPPPPATNGAMTTPAPGDIPSGGSAQPSLGDEVIQGVLNFLGGLVP